MELKSYSLQLKADLKNKIANNKIDSVIQILITVFQDLNKINIVRSKQRERSAIEDERRKNIIKDDDYKITSNKIANILLELIDEITDTEATLYYIHNTVFQKILVLCRDEKRIEYMEKLFKKKFFENTSVTHDLEFKNESNSTFDLIIYDNFPKDMNSSKISSKLKEILDNDKIKNILFFGPENIPDLQKKHSDRVYFSNSKFSIHSRLNEMLLFLKYEGDNQ